MNLYDQVAALLGLPRSYVKQRILYLMYGAQTLYPEDELLMSVVGGWVIAASRK
jgi:hypothetical protein